MNTYNPYRRFLLSIVVTLLLGGLFLAFRAATSPFLDVEHQKRTFGSHDHRQNISTELVDQARKWIPDHSWVAESKKHFRDDGRYLYCREFGLTDNDKTVTVEPIAMILHGKPGTRPYTIVADSARLESSTPISPNSSKFGKIVGGVLAGNVRIEGPRGLRIEGRRFRLDEASLKLWSTDPVKFQMDEHRGLAQKGVDIYLESPADRDGGLTSVTDVRKVRLNGRVKFEFVLPATHANKADQALHVDAAAGFSYETLTRTGVFSGRKQASGESKLKTPSNEVLVTRLVDGNVTDQIVCPELMLRFRNAMPSEKDKPDSQTMKIEHVKAWGRQVLYKSRTHDIMVNANEFSYAVTEGRIDIYRTNNSPTPVAPSVEVIQGKSTLPVPNILRVPHIRVLHTPNNEVQRLELNGHGSIAGAPPPKTGQKSSTDEANLAFNATWEKSLTMQVAPDQVTRVVTLDGGASVSEASREFQLKAQTIAMKLVSLPAATAEIVDKSGVIKISHETTSNPESDSSFAIENLRPKLMTATGNVALNSPQASGQLRDKLSIKFEDRLPQPQGTKTKKDITKTGNDEKERDIQVSFEADSLEAVVGLSLNPDDRTAELRNIWLTGDVEVVSQSEDADKSFTANGNFLHATGSQADDLEISLVGDPARFKSASRKLEGTRIDLDLSALEKEARVPVSGKIRFQVDKGFDRRKLAKPTPLDIYWSNRMVFHKRSAQFFGNIRMTMSDGETQDAEITCTDMTVHFSEDITLDRKGEQGEFEAVPAEDSKLKRASEMGPIERIEFHNTVRVRIDEWVDGEPMGRHRAEFADLNINLDTGDFNAIGQGFLESVRPDSDGQLQGAAPAVARANTPSQTSGSAFVYLRVEFIGDLHGNIDRKEANLTHNVMALVAPAQRIDDEINLDVPASELPELAGILQSEVLTISAIDGGADAANGFAIVARDNARLRSRSLSASGADVIFYDHQKQQFIMKADGKGSVRVNHQNSPGSKLNSLSGKRFEYYRRTNQLNAEGFGGLQLNSEGLERFGVPGTNQ